MNQRVSATNPTKRAAIASLRVKQGTTTERARVFTAGSEVAPFSVGSCADWCVAADGVEPHHFYLCFDGQTLFAATAAGGPLTTVSGKRVEGRWTSLPDGSVLTFGDAAMAVTNVGERPARPLASPVRRADLRGPRVLDPFACETLAYSRFSPPASVPREVSEEDLTLVRRASDPVEIPGILHEPLAERTVVRPSDTFEALRARAEPLDEPTVVRSGSDMLEAGGVLPAESSSPQGTTSFREPLEEPTVVYRPWAREFALKPFVRALDESLAQTIARPVTTPMAVALGTTMPGLVVQPSGAALGRAGTGSRAAAQPTLASAAQTPLLRKCIAGLIVAAVVLIGVRALTGRQRPALPSPASAAIMASSRAITAASSVASARVERPQSAEPSPLSNVNGKTPERQAVDLVARGAYNEAAALYDQLARVRDVPAFREAARIARRKARLAR